MGRGTLGGSGAGLIDVDVNRHGRAVAPQAFESVVLALFLGQDMDEQIRVIQEHPGTLRTPLDVGGAALMLDPDAIHDVLGNGTHLTVRRRRNNHEGIRQGELAGHVDKHRVDAAAVMRGASNQARQFCGSVGKAHVSPWVRTGTGRIC